MSTDPFAGLLDPVAYLDISGVYLRYSAFFDLLIYCTIFVAVAHVAFVRRFSGRPGRVLAVTIGLALGVSLAMAGQRFGFNLRSAGPIAVLIALLLVGVLVLHTLLQVHVSWRIAAPLTYVLMYLFVRAISPSAFAMVANRVPLFNLLAVIVFLVCLWQIGLAIWPKTGGGFHRNGSDASFIAGLDRKDEEREERAQKPLAKKLAPRAYRETRRIEHTLEAVQNELRREHVDWPGVARALSNIAHRSDETIQSIDRIRTLDLRMRNFDWRELQRLSGYYGQLNGGDNARLKDQILLERGKILQEHAINELTERCERRHGELRRLLDDAQRSCSTGDRDAALRQVSTAVALEIQQKQELKSLREAERRLLDLIRTKLKKENDNSPVSAFRPV